MILGTRAENMSEKAILKELADTAVKRHIITGSVDPTAILIGSFDEVLQLCKQDIEKAKHSPQDYMLGR